MTLPPKDYIAARRAELYQQKQAIEAELDVLARMESALPGPSQPTIYREEVVENPRRQKFDKSIKEMVLEVLKDGAGRHAQDVLHEIKTTFGVVVERTSLSPQLSRLKVDGMIDRADGNYWIITPAGVGYLSELKLGLDIFS